MQMEFYRLKYVFFQYTLIFGYIQPFFLNYNLCRELFFAGGNAVDHL